MTNGQFDTSTFVIKTMDTMFAKDDVGIASAMAIVLLVITIIVTIIQKVFFSEGDGNAHKIKRSRKGARI